jgi:ATP-dependent Clp protease adaptor protein ClpS
MMMNSPFPFVLAPCEEQEPLHGVRAGPGEGPGGGTPGGGAPGGPGVPGSGDPADPGGPGNGTALATRTKARTRKPSLYRVLILNDDYTPMEFVVYVLERFFNKTREDATRIMLHVHQNGVGVCGVFSYEVAETKVAQVLDMARRNEHPLQCTMEKE